MEHNQEKQLLEGLVIRELKKSDPKLSVVDFNFGSKEYGFIDILAVDSKGQLEIINFFSSASIPSLINILNNYKFVLEMRHNLKQLYPAQTIDAQLPPKCLLVAPCFSSQFLRILSFLDSVKLNLFRYTLEISRDIKNIKLFKVELEPNKVHNTTADTLKERLRKIAPTISDEEIDTFLSFFP